MQLFFIFFVQVRTMLTCNQFLHIYLYSVATTNILYYEVLLTMYKTVEFSVLWPISPGK